MKRQEYLKQQSAKHYIRNVDRTDEPTIKSTPNERQHALLDSLMTDWEDYLRTMFVKSQSEEMVDARQPHCRQKVHNCRKYWRHY